LRRNVAFHRGTISRSLREKCHWRTLPLTRRRKKLETLAISHSPAIYSLYSLHSRDRALSGPTQHHSRRYALTIAAKFRILFLRADRKGRNGGNWSSELVARTDEHRGCIAPINRLLITLANDAAPASRDETRDGFFVGQPTR